MEVGDYVLIALLVGALILATVAVLGERHGTCSREPFATFGGDVAGLTLTSLGNQALDSAPTTSEVKDHYKKLLLFADADIRKQGTKGLRILADLRNRLFDRPDFRDDLTVEDFLRNYPDWLPPLDPTIQEQPPTDSEAVLAELRILAYLQRYFPQESIVDEQTGSTIRNLVEDIGRRFVFKDGETVQLRDDFLRQPLIQGWVNPIARP